MDTRRRRKTESPVQIRYSFVPLHSGSDLAIRRLPMMSAVSSTSGPIIWLTACIHGDEIVGIAVIQEVFKRIRRRLRRGSIYAFPVANPFGLETASRKIAISSEDLNRSFPGSATGTLGERIADRIFQTILGTSPDLLLDLHSDWKRSIPYTVIDRKPAAASGATFKRVLDVARLTGFVCIQEDVEMSNSLSHNLLRMNIPALTLELGEPYIVNEENVSFGLNAVLNILAELDMVETKGAPFFYPLPAGYEPESTLHYSDKPYSSTSGIVRFVAGPGQSIRHGDTLAKIVNPFGKHQETIRAIRDGIVLGHTDSSVVFPGMPIMAFGVVP